MPGHELDALLRDQDGVVACFQVLESGLDPRQRAWAAVLHYWPAALADGSALTAAGLRAEDPPGRPSDTWPVHVAVDLNRRLARTGGIRLHPIADLTGRVQANLSPPRLCLEDALVRVASRQRTDEAAVACLADACQSRRTIPAGVARRGRVGPPVPWQPS
ncbi:MAG TPA: hypothetical protein VFJ09_06630 [Nocardioidaceae bacterium]|nr:hypothetical protein [Nocardioidaceae bacterium]